MPRDSEYLNDHMLSRGKNGHDTVTFADLISLHTNAENEQDAADAAAKAATPAAAVPVKD